MLCMNQYPAEYVDACRERMAEQWSKYHSMLVGGKGAEAARKEFELQFFNNLVLALDMSFVHRARGKEGKDGNALNEVRMLSASILNNNGVLAADTTIKYDPEKSVLGLRVGDEIRVDQDRFVQLAVAFFDEISSKYT